MVSSPAGGAPPLEQHWPQLDEPRCTDATRVTGDIRLTRLLRCDFHHQRSATLALSPTECQLLSAEAETAGQTARLRIRKPTLRDRRRLPTETPREYAQGHPGRSRKTVSGIFGSGLAARPSTWVTHQGEAVRSELRTLGHLHVKVRCFQCAPAAEALPGFSGVLKIPDGRQTDNPSPATSEARQPAAEGHRGLLSLMSSLTIGMWAYWPGVSALGK